MKILYLSINYLNKLINERDIKVNGSLLETVQKKIFVDNDLRLY